jgi:hypothetical protein
MGQGRAALAAARGAFDSAAEVGATPGTDRVLGCVHCSRGRRARPSRLPGRVQSGYRLRALERRRALRVCAAGGRFFSRF